MITHFWTHAFLSCSEIYFNKHTHCSSSQHEWGAIIVHQHPREASRQSPKGPCQHSEPSLQSDPKQRSRNDAVGRHHWVMHGSPCFSECSPHTEFTGEKPEIKLHEKCISLLGRQQHHVKMEKFLQWRHWLGLWRPGMQIKHHAWWQWMLTLKKLLLQLPSHHRNQYSLIFVPYCPISLFLLHFLVLFLKQARNEAFSLSRY